jgi:hypothetical protein
MANPTTNTFLARIQTDPRGDNSVAEAFFGRETTIDNLTFQAPWTSVSWPLNSTKIITVDGTALSYAQVTEFLKAIAFQEKAEADAAAATATTTTP